MQELARVGGGGQGRERMSRQREQEVRSLESRAPAGQQAELRTPGVCARGPGPSGSWVGALPRYFPLSSLMVSTCLDPHINGV